MEPYVTQDGREIPLRAIGRRYVELEMDKHPLPEVPTYEAETAAGEVEVHPHQVQYDGEGKITKSTMTTDEEWAAWHAYEAAREEAVAARYQAATYFLLYNCIPAQPAPVAEWSVDLDLWGIEVPDPEADPVAFKIFWIENEYLPDSDDLTGILARLYEAAGLVAKDRAREFEAFFRLALARLAPGGAAGATAGRPARARAARGDADA